MAFAFSDISSSHLQQCALRFTCPSISSGQRYWVSTACPELDSGFHIIDPMSDLGVPWTPVVPRLRTGTLETCNLTTRYSHIGIAFNLLSLSRFVAALTMRVGVQLISPYHSSLALNRGGFPEGSACHHFDPIRYVVREASHPVISATAARSRRDRQEHAGYSPISITVCKYTQLCDIVSHFNEKLRGRA